MTRAAWVLITMALTLLSAERGLADCPNVVPAVIGLDGTGSAYVITSAYSLDGSRVETLWQTNSATRGIAQLAKTADCSDYSRSNEVVPTVSGGQCSSILVSPLTLPAGFELVPYTQTFTLSGTVLHATLNGALPAGLTWDSATRTISGTPTQTGSFPLALTVSVDSTRLTEACTATTNYTLVIARRCPVLSLQTSSSLTVATGSALILDFWPRGSSSRLGLMEAYTSLELSGQPSGLSVVKSVDATYGHSVGLRGTPTQSGTFPLSYSVTDAEGCTSTGTITLTVTGTSYCDPNAITVTAGLNSIRGTVGETYSKDLSAFGGTAPYTYTATGLPPGVSVAGANVIGTPTTAGTYAVRITATDARGCTGTSAYTVIIGTGILNECTSPIVSPLTLPLGTERVAYSQTFTVTGVLTNINLAGTLPAGMLWNSATRTLSGTPTESGSFPLTLTTNTENAPPNIVGCTAVNRFTLTITSRCPTLSLVNQSPLTATTGRALILDFWPRGSVTRRGIMEAYTSLELSGQPAGLSVIKGVDPIYGHFVGLRGTPTQSGTFPLNYSVTDAEGCTSTGTITLTVSGTSYCDPTAITVTAGLSTIRGTVGESYYHTLSASGGTAPYTYTATGLPPGVSALAGIVVGIPSKAGTYAVTITATDARGCTGSAAYSVIIGTGILNECTSPIVSPLTLRPGTEGVAYSQTFTVTGVLASINLAGTLPAGMTWNSATRILSGTPTESGSFPLTLTTNTDNAPPNIRGCMAINRFTLVIASRCPTLHFDTTSSIVATGRQVYQEHFPRGSTVAYTELSLTGLPSGLAVTQVNSATYGRVLVITGTPNQVGHFPLSYSISDANGCTSTGTMNLTVFGTSSCDAVPIAVTAGLSTIRGTVGELYTKDLSAFGGTAPYTYTATGLPPGVSVAGTNVVGVPSVGGTYAVTVTATDARGCTGTASYSVVIDMLCPAPVVTPLALPSGSERVPYSQTFATNSQVSGMTLTGTLPAGITWNAAARTLSGTPTQSGSFPLTLMTRTSGAAITTPCTVINRYNLLISNRCSPLSLSPSSVSATVGSPISFDLYPQGSTAAYTVLNLTGLPSGLTAAPNSSTASPNFLTISGTTTQSGVFRLSYSVADANGCTSTGSVALTLRARSQAVTTTWSGWQAANPLNGSNAPTQNPDYDLYVNLLEYALASSPRDGLPQLRINLEKDSQDNVSLVYNRAAGLTDVTFTVQGITELANSPGGWQTVSITPTITNNGDGTETVRYTNINQAGFFASTTSGFVRLRVGLNGSSSVGLSQTFGWTKRTFDPRTTSFSNPFLNAEIFAGKVDGIVSSNRLTITSSIQSGNSLRNNMQPGVEYFVEVLSGTAEGQRFEIDEANTTDNIIALDLTGSRNTSGTVSLGCIDCPVVVRAHHTVGQLLPVGDFVGSTSATTADRVMFFDSTTQSYRTLWLLASGNVRRWLLAGDATSADAGTRILNNGEGLLVQLRGNAITRTYIGAVRQNKFAQPLVRGTNMLGMGFPMDLNPLARAQDSTNGFVGSNNPATADKIQFWQQDTSPTGTGFDSYFLLSAGTVQQWTRQGDNTLASFNAAEINKRTNSVFMKTVTDRPSYTQPVPWQP